MNSRHILQASGIRGVQVAVGVCVSTASDAQGSVIREATRKMPWMIVALLCPTQLAIAQQPQAAEPLRFITVGRIESPKQHTARFCIRRAPKPTMVLPPLFSLLLAPIVASLPTG